MVTKGQELTKSQMMKSFDTLPDDATVGDFVNQLAFMLRMEVKDPPEASKLATHRPLGTPGEPMKKRQLMKSLDRLPEDATVDDVIYNLYVILKVENGLAAANAGNKVSQEEARELMKHWLQ